MKPRRASAKTIVVVGAGGNIGSHLVSHLARMPDVSHITLIDKDVYEPKNLTSQDIDPRDIGKPKTIVQARRLTRINPQLWVEPIAGAVECVPLGKLRGDVILSCLDSRSARQHVNQFAWRLGVPLIDAGVDAGGLLARINVYVPEPGKPCLECAWDDRDYEALEQTYPCDNLGQNLGQGRAANTTATNAPSSLGALAASLQAIECQKLLLGQTGCVAIGKQVLIDATHHRHYVTSYRRNPDCRFGSHDVWDIRPLKSSLTLREALNLAPSDGTNGSASLQLEGKPFVTKLTCSGCGRIKCILHLECSLRDIDKTCAHCGQRMMAAGFDLLERLNAGCVPRPALTSSLRKLGLRPNDVFSVGSEHHLRYEIAHETTAKAIRGTPAKSV